MHFNSGFGILVLCLQVAAALEVNDIQVPKGSMSVREGERLLIPCSFKTDGSVRSANLRVEWGILQGKGRTYRPIYRVTDAVLEGVPEPNPFEGRAQMFISLIPNNNCSLVLQGMTVADSGEYQVRFYTDKQVTMSQTITVNVKAADRTGKHGSPESNTNGKEANGQLNCSEFADFDKHLISLTKGISVISARTGVSTLGLEIIGGVVTAILLMGSMAGLILCCHFYSGARNLEKRRCQMERRVSLKASTPDEDDDTVTDQWLVEEPQQAQQRQKDQRQERRQEECRQGRQQQTEDEAEGEEEEEDNKIQTGTSAPSSSSMSPLCQYGYALIRDSDTSACSFQ